MTKKRHYNDGIDHIDCSTPKTKLKFFYQTDEVWPMTKTRQDNYVTDYIGAIYAEIRTELSWPIK